MVPLDGDYALIATAGLEGLLGKPLHPQLASGLAQLAAAGDAANLAVNESLEGVSASQIIAAAIAATLLAQLVLSQLRSCLRSDIKRAVFRFAIGLPIVRGFAEKETQKETGQLWEKYHSRRQGSMQTIPKRGLSKDEIISRLGKGEAASREWYIEGGARLSGAVYSADPAHWDLVSEVMRMYIVSNPLHIEEFLSVGQMEAEVLRMTINLFHGGEECCGVGTSGGTESIILACLAYREHGKTRGISRPNIVMSQTAHPAFDKAGFYMGIEIRKVPLKKGLYVDLPGLKSQIDRNTVALVGSAPDYCYGNFDPLPEIAAMAQKYGIGCHSDCCLGSFNNAFAEEAGHPLPCAVDFAVPGVTSISCDPHKYAYGPKGFSVCMFRGTELRKGQFFACMNWPGGFYATTTMAGSRPGATIAGTWAALASIGHEGYVRNTRQILDGAAQMRARLAAEVPEVTIATRDHSSLVTIVSNPEKKKKAKDEATINALALADVLCEEFKWTLNKLQNPAGCHLAVTLPSSTEVEGFVSAVKDAVSLMRQKPELNHSSSVATYGMAATLSMVDVSYVNDMCKLHSAALLDALG